VPTRVALDPRLDRAEAKPGTGVRAAVAHGDQPTGPGVAQHADLPPADARDHWLALTHVALGADVMPVALAHWETGTASRSP
jgi:hypothetical protein